MQEKELLREEMRQKRRAVSPQARRIASRLLAEKLLQKACVRRASVVAVYLASAQELDLTDLIAELLRRGIQVSAPRWNGETYELAALTSLERATLHEGPMHILEPCADACKVDPAEVEVWILPGLGFTPSGARLGYGGGWYDRLLAAASSNAHRLGVCYDFQVLEALPTEEHDCYLTEIVSVPVK